MGASRFSVEGGGGVGGGVHVFAGPLAGDLRLDGPDASEAGMDRAGGRYAHLWMA